MIGFALIGISHSGNKRLMAQFLRRGNSCSLRAVVDTGDTRSVLVLQHIVRDSFSFGTALGFGST
jgi:hypothetical protein